MSTTIATPPTNKSTTVLALNTLLANYKIYFHKLLNYQWLIQASANPELNEDIHQYAEEAEEQMDVIVDQIEQLGAVPVGNWSKWQKQASIKFRIPTRGAGNILNKIMEDTKQLEKASELVQRSARIKQQAPVLRMANNIHQRLGERMQTLRKIHRQVAVTA